jgi:hypothetical protein
VGKSDETKWIEPMALVCADSFLRTAQSFIDVERIRRDLPEGPIGTFGQSIGDLAVCATNLAFALEIYLKCLRTQLGLSARSRGGGHDLWELYKDLPLQIKREIEERYERGRTHPHPIHASIAFAIGRSPEPPIWSNVSEKSMGLGDVLKRSKDVFVSWRYVFEVKKSEDDSAHQQHAFEYLLLLFACAAINAVILRNWFTPRLGTDPNAPRAWMVLSDRDFAKVSTDHPWMTATVTDQYTGKRYRIRNIAREMPVSNIDAIAEEV